MEKKVKVIRAPLKRPTNKRVAAYARVSVDFEENLHSLASQISYYNRLIQEHRGWEFAGIFSDEGLSGTTKNRPGFQSLMEACETGQVDIILTKSISRFARNTVDLLNTVRHLKELGIEVRFERENINSLEDSGELLLTLLASFAQEESRSISDNTKWAIRKKFEEGRGNNFILYGYRWKDGEWYIEPSEGENVKSIFREYLEGSTPDELSKKYGLAYSTIWGMLRRINYTGCVMLQRTYKENHLTHKTVPNEGVLPRYFVEDFMPALISKETFGAVQEEIERRKELGWMANKSLNFTCFTGHVFCDRCGASYRRKQTQSKNRKTGMVSINHKWVCSTKITGGSSACNSCNVPEKVLWNLSAEVLGMDGLDQDEFLKQIEKITVGEYRLWFHLLDGSIEERTWKPERNNPVYKEGRRRNAEKESDNDTCDTDKIHVAAS